MTPLLDAGKWQIARLGYLEVPSVEERVDLYLVPLKSYEWHTETLDAGEWQIA